MVSVYRIILETDADVIASRVAMRGADADVPLSEQVLRWMCASALLSLSICSCVVVETFELCADHFESTL